MVAFLVLPRLVRVVCFVVCGLASGVAGGVVGSWLALATIDPVTTKTKATQIASTVDETSLLINKPSF